MAGGDALQGLDVGSAAAVVGSIPDYDEHGSADSSVGVLSDEPPEIEVRNRDILAAIVGFVMVIVVTFVVIGNTDKKTRANLPHQTPPLDAPSLTLGVSCWDEVHTESRCCDETVSSIGDAKCWTGEMTFALCCPTGTSHPPSAPPAASPLPSEITSNSRGDLDIICQCIFPFTYAGTQYNVCAQEGTDEPWCATMIDTTSNEAAAWSECRNCRMTLTDPACPVCPTECSSGFLVTAFGNEQLAGEPMLTACSTSPPVSIGAGNFAPIDFPDVQSMSALLESPRTMFFSVRWSGHVVFGGETGTSFVFIASTDDGSRLTVGGNEILNHWDECCATWRSAPVREIAGSAGKHLAFEMHQGAGAAYASLSWQQA